MFSLREEFALEKVEQEANARALLDEIIMLLQSFSQHNANVVDKMKLMQISRNMVGTPAKSTADIEVFVEWGECMTFYLNELSCEILSAVDEAWANNCFDGIPWF